jgi:hypothetical protein
MKEGKCISRSVGAISLLHLETCEVLSPVPSPSTGTHFFPKHVTDGTDKGKGKSKSGRHSTLDFQHK